MNCKSIKRLLLAVCMVAIMAGCAPEKDVTILAEGEVEHTLVMYLLADNNLSASIYNNALDAEKGMIGASPATRLVIYLDKAEDSKLYEVRYLPYGDGGEHLRHCKVLKTYPRQVSTTPEVMKSVMEDVKELAPSHTYGLVLSGHGTGWFPDPSSGVGYDKQKVAPFAPRGVESEYFFDLWRDNPLTRSMGYDYAQDADGEWERDMDDCFINSAELLEGLSPIHFDYIIFDACFMSSVEFLYDIRTAADYVVASPVEILAVGLPYVEIVSTLMSHNSNINRLGEVIMDVYMRDNSFTLRKSLALTLIDCSKLEALAESVAAIYASTGAEDYLAFLESRLKKALHNSRVLPYYEDVQPMDRMRPAGFHDFEDLVCKLTDDEALRQQFMRALDDVVEWSLHTEDIFSQGYGLDGYFDGGGNIEYKVGDKLELCGINTYIPVREAPITYSHYKQTAWAKRVFSLE